MEEKRQKKKFVYFLGGLGSYVDLFAKSYSSRHPEYVFPSFKDVLLVERNSYGNEVSSYPPYLISQSYFETLQKVSDINFTATQESKSIINYGAGSNIHENLRWFNTIKKLDYELIIIYVNVPLEQQIKNVAEANLKGDIHIDEGVVIDTYNRLIVHLPEYINVADKFKKIN